MNKKISVIMPVYNEEQNLEESITAFLNQSIANECELICVDDGSTDESPGILARAVADNPTTIRLFHQNNLGSGPARNKGLEVAEGKYIAFLDSDDSYPADDVLETMYNIAESKQFDIVGGSLERLRSGVRFRHEASGDYARYYSGHVFENDGIVQFEDYQFEYGYYRFIYRKKLLDDEGIRFPSYRRFQDPPFMVHAMIAARQFYALEKETYTYRSGERSVSWNSEKIKDLLEGIIEVSECALENNLETLYDNCVHRLTAEFAPRFRKTIIEGRMWNLYQDIDSTRLLLVDIGEKLGLGSDPRLDCFYINDFQIEIERLDNKLNKIEQTRLWKARKKCGKAIRIVSQGLMHKKATKP